MTKTYKCISTIGCVPTFRDMKTKEECHPFFMNDGPAYIQNENGRYARKPGIVDFREGETYRINDEEPGVFFGIPRLLSDGTKDARTSAAKMLEVLLQKVGQPASFAVCHNALEPVSWELAHKWDGTAGGLKRILTGCMEQMIKPYRGSVTGYAAIQMQKDTLFALLMPEDYLTLRALDRKYPGMPELSVIWDKNEMPQILCKTGETLKEWIAEQEAPIPLP